MKTIFLSASLVLMSFAPVKEQQSCLSDCLSELYATNDCKELKNIVAAYWDCLTPPEQVVVDQAQAMLWAKYGC